MSLYPEILIVQLFRYTVVKYYLFILYIPWNVYYDVKI